MLSIAESGSKLFFYIFEFSRKKWIKVDFLIINIKFPISITIYTEKAEKYHFAWTVLTNDKIFAALLLLWPFRSFPSFLQFTVKVFSLQVSVLSSSVFFENDALALTAKMSVDNMKDSSSRKKKLRGHDREHRPGSKNCWLGFSSSSSPPPTHAFAYSNLEKTQNLWLYSFCGVQAKRKLELERSRMSK